MGKDTGKNIQTIDAVYSRLQGLIKSRNAEEYSRVRSVIEAQQKRLPAIANLDMKKGRLAVELRCGIAWLSQGMLSVFSCRLDSVNSEICQLLEYQRRFTYSQWKIKEQIDSSLPDEANIECLDRSEYVSFEDDVDQLVQLFKDFLMTLGKFARNVHSIVLPNIIRCIVRCRKLGGYGPGLSHEEAMDLTREIVESWLFVLAEHDLMDEEERVGIYPEPPAHAANDDEAEEEEEEEEFDVDDYSDSDDPDELTAKSYAYAYRRYEKEMAYFLPKKDEDGISEFHPMEHMSEVVKRLADEMEGKSPSIDRRWHRLNGALLSRILGTRFDLMYEKYQRVTSNDGDEEIAYYSVKLEHDACLEDTRESLLKKNIVVDMERFITSAARLAKDIKSESYNKWSRMLVLLSTYRGDFTSSDLLGNDADAKRDLKEFMTLLREARQQIWSDNKMFDPTAAKVRVEIDEHSIDKQAKAIGREFDTATTAIVDVARSVRPPAKDRDDILALVREVYNTRPRIKGVTSYMKAAYYVRDLNDVSSEFYQRAVWAQGFARTHKGKPGLPAYWRSIGQDAKPGAAKAKQKAKAKRNGGAPGPVSILPPNV